MNCWLFVIPRDELWIQCRKRSVCAAGFKGRKKGDESSPGWRKFVQRASEVAPGDLVVTYLKKNRVGAVGKVLEKYGVYDWEPLISGNDGGDYGRLLKVEWDQNTLPPEGKVSLIPQDLRRGGEQLATLNKIRNGRLKEFQEILAKPENWITIGPAKEVEPEPSDDDENEGLAMLEVHLRDLLSRAPEKLDKGIRLYADEAGSVEVVTDVGNIDILCVDSENNPVVVELKRGSGSDRAVGQILRYMGWLVAHRDQFPEAAGKKVRGIVVAFQPDERLKYAASVVPNLEVKSYRMQLDIV